MHFAARWCAKEALRKCDPGFATADHTAIELVGDENGSIFLRHRSGDGGAVRLPHAVSVTHTAEMAAATVVVGWGAAAPPNPSIPVSAPALHDWSDPHTPIHQEVMVQQVPAASKIWDSFHPVGNTRFDHGARDVCEGIRLLLTCRQLVRVIATLLGRPLRYQCAVSSDRGPVGSDHLKDAAHATTGNGSRNSQIGFSPTSPVVVGELQFVRVRRGLWLNCWHVISYLHRGGGTIFKLVTRSSRRCSRRRSPLRRSAGSMPHGAKERFQMMVPDGDGARGLRWTLSDWLLFACVFSAMIILTLVRREDPSRHGQPMLAPRADAS